MKKSLKNLLLFTLIIAGMQWVSCGQGTTKEDPNVTQDTTSVAMQDTSKIASNAKDSSQQVLDNATTATVKDQSTVLIYNFYVTNRCPSCIAIEDATIKTLNTYFAKEVKQGRIKRQSLNVDDEANSKIAEKYQAFGSGCFVTRVYKGKETTTDLTGDGFKFAKNKEERFIEILKSKITEYLK
jgi:hypothetical protein